MGLKEINYDAPKIEEPQQLTGPYDPAELMEKCAQESYEYSFYKGKMEELDILKAKKEATLGVIIAAKRADLLKTEDARELYEECLKDEKFKPTVDFTASLTALEMGDTLTLYQVYEQRAKMAERLHGMFTSQLMWYMSKNRVDNQDRMGNGGSI